MRVTITEQLVNKLLLIINLEYSGAYSYTSADIQSYTFGHNGIELFIQGISHFVKYEQLCEK